MPARRALLATVALASALAVAGCGSSSTSTPAAPTIAPAKTYELAGFTPARPVAPGKPTRVSFTIRQPNGQALTQFATGPGPHTGVHLIIVRRDLATIIHRHPAIGAGGRIVEAITFPEPGRYHLVLDVYPRHAAGGQRNFQLFHELTVKGPYTPAPVPPFSSTATDEGYRFTLHGHPRLKAISPAFLTVTVARPNGTPAVFTPWYGALAHAIFFRSGSLDYFHTHVCSPGASGCTSVLGASKITGSSSTPGRLTVGVLVPVSGTWRLFLQCQVDGRILTAPFTLQVT